MSETSQRPAAGSLRFGSDTAPASETASGVLSWRSLGALCVGALLGFLVLVYQGGEDSYLRINDNLDGHIPVYSLLAQQPLVGALDQRIDAVLSGGLPRNSLYSTLHLGFLPYKVLPLLHAFVLNELVARLVAFTGMLLLLRARLLPGAPPWIVCGSALCFALLPFFPAGHLSVAGQPWLLHAVLNLRERRGRVRDWLVVTAFPLYSSLVFIGLYILLLVGMLAVYDLIRSRRVPTALVLAVALMGALYALSEYRLLHQTLFEQSYVSFRSEWDHRASPLLVSFRNAGKMFLFSQHHAPAVQFPFVLGAVALALGLEASRRASWRDLFREPWRRASWARPSPALLLLTAISLAAVLCAGVALYNWHATQAVLQSIPLARMFGFHRFQWFHPLLFGLAFALALELVARARRVGPPLALILLVAQLGWLVWSSDALREKREAGVTFREFYSPALFREIQEYIGRPPSSYRVASFGLIPWIATYNGFYVVDAFLSNYPLEYKHAFRRVIAPELEKDRWLANHYDKWGAHVHLYSSELGMIVGYRKRGLFTKEQPVRAVEHVQFDAAALRDLGGEYVLSAVEIRNHEALGLEFQRTFERDDSPWEIFLYAVSP